MGIGERAAVDAANGVADVRGGEQAVVIGAPVVGAPSSHGMTAMIRLSMLAAAFALTAAAAPALADPAGSSLTLTFDTAAQSGKVMVALYDTQAAYDGGQPVRVAQVDVAGGAHDAVFSDLPAGEYAAKTFHDVDGDGSMDKNPFGLPTEPYAFTNNAVGNMGPASWDRAKVAVNGAVAQTIRLR
mgnify:CR=1 FL=1